jgi:curved DNA-binding protein CbpA
MVPERYYRIMGLEPGASQEQIRKQYRILVKKYHPDKNPARDASEHFIRIQHAYEILTGKKKFSVSAPKGQNRSRTQSREEMRRQARKRYEQKMAREKEEIERFYQALFKGRRWFILRISAITGLMIAALLTMEWFAPFHTENVRIQRTAKDVSSFNDEKNLSALRANNQLFWITDYDTKAFSSQQTVWLRRSWFFHEPVDFLVLDQLHAKKFELKLTFYSFGVILAILFALPGFVYIFPRRNTFYVMLYYIALWVSTPCILYFIFRNDHWAHLLSLGWI